MGKLIKNLHQWNQPQMFSLFVTVLIVFIVSLVVYIKVKKEAKPDKAPKPFLFFVEGYVTTIERMYDGSAGGKLPKAKIYILGLATFILIGNLLGLFGLEPIATSYSVTLTMALITFLGIYVVGILYQKWRFFKRYIIPVELIGQFAPLISLSFRIFGNIVGGSTILFLTYYVFGVAWTAAFKTNQQLFFFAPIVTPFMHMYFDIFGACIQTMVFTILTTIYWSREAEEIQKKSKKIKNNKKSSVINTNQAIY